MVQAEAERHRRGGGGAGAGAGERLGVVVVSVHEQKLEAGPAEQSTCGAEEAAPFRVARQVAEVAEGDERVAALLDGALDQASQVASVAVKVAEDEQTAHSAEATERAPARGRLGAGPAALVAVPAIVQQAAAHLADSGHEEARSLRMLPPAVAEAIAAVEQRLERSLLVQ
jgi:hypothetical protein